VVACEKIGTGLVIIRKRMPMIYPLAPKLGFATGTNQFFALAAFNFVCR
jgi:hypothetical protein